MTVTEIANFLDISRKSVYKAVHECSQNINSLKCKYIDGKILIRNVDFSEAECRAIFRKLNASKMQMLLLEEHFEYLKISDYYTIEGTHKFLENWKKGIKNKCCNTCKHLCGDKSSSIQAVPFCNYYKCRLTVIKAKVYRDFCTHYEQNNYDKPVIWLTDKAPTNLNKFGEPVTNSRSNLPTLEEAEKNNPPFPLVGFF